MSLIKTGWNQASGRQRTAIVIAHCHPAGSPEPSANDVALTRQLQAGALVLGIKLLDHLVLGDGRYVSMKLRGDCPSD